MIAQQVILMPPRVQGLILSSRYWLSKVLPVCGYPAGFPAGRWIEYSKTEWVCVWWWIGTLSSVPGIGSGSIVTFIKIKAVLKKKEWMSYLQIIHWWVTVFWNGLGPQVSLQIIFWVPLSCDLEHSVQMGVSPSRVTMNPSTVHKQPCSNGLMSMKIICCGLHSHHYLYPGGVFGVSR